MGDRPENTTLSRFIIYEYYGCFFHGCKDCFDAQQEIDTVINHDTCSLLKKHLDNLCVQSGNALNFS
jgi:hypothetical protein